MAPGQKDQGHNNDDLLLTSNQTVHKPLLELKYNEFLSRSSRCIRDLQPLKLVNTQSKHELPQKKNRSKGIQEELNPSEIVCSLYYCVFKERFIYNLAKKTALILKFFNSSLIKAFRVSSAASSKF